MMLSHALGRVPFAVLLCFVFVASSFGTSLGAQDFSADHFRQLEELLPTANVYRTASGAPGTAYWQQRADIDINVEINVNLDVEIDDETQRLIGSDTITYYNQSPDT